MSEKSDVVSRGLAAWWTALGAAALLVALHLAYVGGDGLLYIAHGRFILERGELPVVDPFSEMSSRAPLILHMLLPMLGFAWLDRHLGLESVVVVSAVAGAAVLALFLAPACRSVLATVAGAGLLALLVLVDKEFFGARGQVFAYAWLSAWLAICLRVLEGGGPSKARRPPLPVVVLVPVLWANTHPSFLVAVILPLLLAAALLLEPSRARGAWRALVGLSVVAALASFLSPYGPRLIVDLVRLLTDPTTQRIEHMRTPPLDLAWAAFLVALTAVPVARALFGPVRHRRVHVVVAVAWLVVTLVSRRYAPFAAAWSIVVLAQTFARVRLPLRLERGLVLATGLVAAVALPFIPPPRDVHRALPVEATAVLETVPVPGRLLNEFGWGGWLMYRWGTARPVFIDGRNNLYSRNGVFDDYLQVTFASPAMDRLLDAYGVGTVLWTTGWPLDKALAKRKDTWRELYRDEKAVIYVRRVPR